MGAWDTGNFGNDTALDWVGDFLEARRFAKIASELKRYQKAHDKGQEYDAESALAAAEIVAAFRGHAEEDLPPELAEWIASSRSKVNDETVALAIDVVGRIAKTSELRELWQESDSFTEWQQQLDGLLDRLKKPAQARPKVKQVRGPLLTWNTVKRSEVRHRYQPGNLPNLAEATERIEEVNIDVTERFSLDDYQQIAAWLSADPEIAISITDGRLNLGYPGESDDSVRWDVVIPALRYFRFARSLRLHLSGLRDLSFLTDFADLAKLDLRKYRAIDISSLATLPSLTELVLKGCDAVYAVRRTNKHGQVFDLTEVQPLPESRALDLSQLRGCKAKGYEFEQWLVGDPETLNILSDCERLVLNCELEKMVELPSLKQFHSLRKLFFPAINPQALLNALQAPAIEELQIVVPRKQVQDCVQPLKDYRSLKTLIITGVDMKRLYVKEETQAMEAVGVPRCDW